jgi:deoxyribonuclease V
MTEHSWDVSPSQALRIQERLYPRRILHDAFPDIRHVAGIDVAYSRFSGKACCAATVFSYPDLGLCCVSEETGFVSFPYLPGLFAFREGPLIEPAFGRLEIKPDILIFDGFGVCHPRGMGLATHMGIILDRASIGCAKTPFMGTFENPAPERGSVSPIVCEGEVIGSAVRTKQGVKPVFVSQGHRVSLASSIGICLSCAKGYRIPEPLRHAHIRARKCLHRAEG